MKRFFLISTLFFVLCYIIIEQQKVKQAYEEELVLKKEYIKKQTNEIKRLNKIIEYNNKEINNLKNKVKTLEEKLKYEYYIVTGYDASYESTGKYKSDPLYGITASLTTAKEGVTVACPKEMEFGTVLFIEKVGIRVCEDRGAAIKGKRLDLFFENKADALKFGVQKLKVRIIE